MSDQLVGVLAVVLGSTVANYFLYLQGWKYHGGGDPYLLAITT